MSNKLLVKRDFNWTHGGDTLFRANNKTFEFTWEYFSCMIWNYSNKLTIPHNNKVTTKQLIAAFLFFLCCFYEVDSKNYYKINTFLMNLLVHIDDIIKNS